MSPERTPDPASPDSTLKDLLARAHAAGLSADALRPVFERFLAVCRRFAELETKVLGSVPLQFPTYMYEVAMAEAADPVTAGVALARRERERLDVGSGALDDLLDQVEAQGLKVVQLAFPADCALLGVFVFDAKLGPALLVNAERPRAEREYAAAHLYGHFLADFDPYHSWVCLLAGEAELAPEELRARVFASAFLVPPDDLAAYLAAAGQKPGAPLPGPLLDQLRVYFGADDRAIVGGLLAGGWLAADALPDLLRRAPRPPEEEEPAEGEPLDVPLEEPGAEAAETAAPGENGGGSAPGAPPDGTPRGRLPARYVALALAAHRGGALTLAELARTLEMTESAALALERSMSPPEEEEEGHARRPS